MVILIIDKEIENLECLEEGDKSLYDEIVGILSDCGIVDEFAINVSDKTWSEIKNETMRRLTLNKDEFEQYLKKSDYIFVYKNGKYKLCIST